MSRAWGGGSTRAWRKTRALVLAAAGYRCQVAIPGLCTGRATCVHHKNGKAGGDDPRHLQASCQPCNARVNDPARTSTHQRVVAWVRGQLEPVNVAGMQRQFPGVTEGNIRMILKRAIQRGELTSAGRGKYRAGPTGIPPVIGDPAPRPLTKWGDSA